jgi:hypothetical protein
MDGVGPPEHHPKRELARVKKSGDYLLPKPLIVSGHAPALRRPASLLEMVRGGTVAGVGPGSPLRAVGERFGVPYAWEARWEAPIPRCWHYGALTFYFESTDADPTGLLYAVTVTPPSRRRVLDCAYGGLRFSGNGLSAQATIEDFFAWAARKTAATPQEEGRIGSWEIFYRLGQARFEFYKTDDGHPFLLNSIAVARN